MNVFSPCAAVEPHSLKQLCRLAILHYLTRPRYSLISSLPLPNHLKVIVYYYAYMQHTTIAVLHWYTSVDHFIHSFPPHPPSLPPSLLPSSLTLLPSLPPFLPLSSLTHQEYVAHHRDWGPPQIPFCLRCNDRERESQEEDSDNDFSVNIMSNKIILCDLRGAIHRVGV